MGQIFGLTLPIPQSFLDAIIAKIEQVLKPILGPIRGIVNIFRKFRDTVPGMVGKAQHLIESAITSYRGFTTFNFRDSPRTRVIQSVRAYQELSDLVTKVPQDVLAKLRDLVTIIKSKLNPASFNPEEVEGIEDLRGLVKKFGPKLAKGFEKILGVLGIILDSIVAINQTLDDLQGIVDDIEHVRRSLQNLEGFFLPQTNKRKKVELADGTIINRRVGHFFKD